MLFGDSNDPDSRVSKMAKNTRAYKVLEKLNTLPSIVYLQKVTRHG